MGTRILLLLLLAGTVSGRGQSLFAKRQPLSRDRFRLTGSAQGFFVAPERAYIAANQSWKPASIGCTSVYAMPAGWSLGIGVSYWYIDSYWAESDLYVVRSPAYRFPAVSAAWFLLAESRFDAALSMDAGIIRESGENYLTVLPRTRVTYWFSPHLGIMGGVMSLLGRSASGAWLSTGLPPQVGLTWCYTRPFGKRLKMKSLHPCRP